MIASLVGLVMAGAAPLRRELQPMDFLVGHCWRGTLSGGAPDTHCFEPVFGGQHLRDRHEVRGAHGIYCGETVYSWNGREGGVDYTYWTSTGAVRSGLVTFQSASRFVFSEGRGASAEWHREGDRAFKAVTLVGNDPALNPIIAYRRLPDRSVTLSCR
jgi:hypothetical protein